MNKYLEFILDKVIDTNTYLNVQMLTDTNSEDDTGDKFKAEIYPNVNNASGDSLLRLVNEIFNSRSGFGQNRMILPKSGERHSDAKDDLLAKLK